MATKKVVEISPFAAAEAERSNLIIKISADPKIVTAAHILFVRSQLWGNKFSIGRSAKSPSVKATAVGVILDEAFDHDNSYSNYTARILAVLLDEEIPSSRVATNKVKYETGTVVKLTKNLPGSAHFNYPTGIPLFVVSGASALATPTENGMPQNHLDMTAGNIQIPSEVEISTALADFYLRDSVWFNTFIGEWAK
jgi:hypothetical protein